jgi:hypothetical protein
MVRLSRDRLDMPVIGADCEVAHAMLDRLYIAVLTAIANGTVAPLPSTLAEAALKGEEIEFDRWCA